MGVDRYDFRPHMIFDIQTIDNIIDSARLAPHKVIKVISQKSEKGPDGKMNIWYRCKFFYDEPDARMYWDLIVKYDLAGRVRILRRGRLVGGYGCPESMTLAAGEVISGTT